MNQTKLFLAALLLCSHTVLRAESPPVFSAMDVFELEWATDPQISPDGQDVIYVRNGMDIMKDQARGNLWMVNTDGNTHRKLTSGSAGESNPRWSPDGSRIAFISKDETHGSELYMYWLDDGKLARISQLDRSPANLDWSPDGTQLSFTMLVPEKPPVLVTGPEKPKGAEWADKPRVTTRLRHEADGSGHIEPGFRHLFVIPAEGGTARQVTSGDFQHSGDYNWAPDGETIVFSGNRNENHEYEARNSELYRVSVANGEISALTDRFGPDRSPAVSPDGNTIAWTGYDDKVQAYQVNHLYLMDADGSNKRKIETGLDSAIEALAWDSKSNGLFIQYSHHGDAKIARVSLDGKMRQLAEGLGGTSIGRPYGGGSFSMSSNNTLAYTRANALRPADVAVFSRNGGDVRSITDLNSDLLAHRNLGEVEEIWYKSSFDNRDIQGWIVKPPGYEAGKTYPLILENHGGPISHYGAFFSPEIQLYAAAGYLVFYPNPRGSTSYGEEFANLLYNNYPGEDYLDVMDGVDHVIAAGYTSEDQLYVTGGSAGGLMTAWIVGKNHRFEAAVVAKPVMNWVSKLLVADNYMNYANYRYPGQVWENVENYWKHSPISLVGNVETPTMVMVGTEDLRTPLSEAIQLYHALKVRKIDTALVEIPGAYHLLVKRPSQLIAKVQNILAWFERYPVAEPESLESE